MNEMMHYVMEIEGKYLPIRYIPGPEGVRCRNSDNSNLLHKIGWEPTIKIKDGIR